MILSSFFCYILNMGYILNIDNIYYCLDNDIVFPNTDVKRNFICPSKYPIFIYLFVSV